MEEKKLKVNIATPDKKFYESDADMIIVKTINGEIGIMPNHLPIVSVLDVGIAEIKNGNDIKKATINMGFIQMVNNKINIFTDSAEWPEEIDFERAAEAKKRAEQRLAQKNAENDQRRAELALKRAINRMSLKG